MGLAKECKNVREQISKIGVAAVARRRCIEGIKEG